MKHKIFLIVVALVLLFFSAFNMKAQVRFNELDPNILWVADSTIGRIDGFAVHPNGNVFAYRGNIVSEINGSNGKLIRNLPKFSDEVSLETIDVSDDGKYLAASYTYTYIIDLNTGITKNIIKGVRAKFLPNS